MVAIEVTFLTGRYVATAHHDREAHEWPPHGARLFSAMVATWADAEVPDEIERAALKWLESQPPPRITAPEAVPRRTVSHFVPVNDARVIAPASYHRRAGEIAELLGQFDDEVKASDGELNKKAERLQDKIDKKLDVDLLVGRAGNTNIDSALALLPDGRGKKERYFPSLTLMTPQTAGNTSERQEPAMVRSPFGTVTYAWDENPLDETAEVLDALLGRVARLGHSSSLVSCRLIDDAPPATHTPGDGPSMLRWVRPGQLDALEEEHARHQANRPRSLPFHAVRYREAHVAESGPGELVRPTTAGDWIVFELEQSHRRLPMTRSVELARVLRESLLSHVSDPIPEGVSGHRSDGRPTESPHILFLGLPNVGYEHSDGRIMGLAVSLPDGLDDMARNATLRGIGAWEHKRGGKPLQLRMGPKGEVVMRRRQPPFVLKALDPAVWARCSRWWVSATPVALPAHPGDLRRGSPAVRAKAWARAAESVAKSCEHVGLPRPADVRVSFVSELVGTRPSHDFPVFKQGRGGGGVIRRLVHVSVEFDEEIAGPLVLGSGRFLGLGLMRPMGPRTSNEAVAGEGVGDV
ncbi:MAG: type I-U CRISPR-associated protein Csb2 [Acidimicrobiaceae bacterium]|nr:type I-U CRISPR-associated protein Csb2 [Acidimicrobiaceae bacterium]